MARFANLQSPKMKTHGTTEFNHNALIINSLQTSFSTGGTTDGTTEFLCNILLFNTL